MRPSTFQWNLGFSVKEWEAIQWMSGLVRISAGKAIQWRGPAHSVNCRTLKTEKLLSSPPSRKSALMDPTNMAPHSLQNFGLKPLWGHFLYCFVVVSVLLFVFLWSLLFFPQFDVTVWHKLVAYQKLFENMFCAEITTFTRSSLKKSVFPGDSEIPEATKKLRRTNFQWVIFKISSCQSAFSGGIETLTMSPFGKGVSTLMIDLWPHPGSGSGSGSTSTARGDAWPWRSLWAGETLAGPCLSRARSQA